MITLVSEGRPVARIVIGTDAQPVELHAAGELQKYIRLITGAELPIEHCTVELERGTGGETGAAPHSGSGSRSGVPLPDAARSVAVAPAASVSARAATETSPAATVTRPSVTPPARVTPRRDAMPPGTPSIYIGSSVPPEARLAVEREDLGLDGYVVRTVGDDLILAGTRPYSSLYAVYHLLERHLGCGFFEDGDQVPKRNSLSVGQIDDVCKPHFEWRLYHNNMAYAYSGMRWWEWDQMKSWVDWLAKKRYNMWDPTRIVSQSGIGAIAAGKLGVSIELTPYQQKQQSLMRLVLDYARMLGIRIPYSITEIYSQTNQTTPGTYSYVDRIQLEEFIRKYPELTGEPISVLTYEWCGTPLPVLDPRSPVTQRFVSAVVEAYSESLGTDHLYSLALPSEGGWQSDNQEEMNRVTYAMLTDLIGAVKAGDPEATVFAPPPFPYGKTFEAQKKAVQDAGLPLMCIEFLNIPGRLHSYQMFDYFWGLQWMTGMTLTCGKHTNPYGDIGVAIRNARAVASDPHAHGCKGFSVGTEIHHRILMLSELFAELAWNPADVSEDDYLLRFTARRYGLDAAGAMQKATELVASSLLSHYNMDLTNHPLYRDWRGGYLPGLTPVSVKRTLSFLPAMRAALETMLSQHDKLAGSDLYRFDVVDLGRTYLGALFNDRLARARKAMRSMDRTSFEQRAGEIEGIMKFLALYCSADPQFHLETIDDWARRWPPILPGYANEESNWITFTALISPEYWSELLDYTAEDFAELLQHYYWPRVRLYLEKMRAVLDAGQDISGRLVHRGSDRDMPFRVGDFAPPRGLLPWSPYGSICEPELTAGDDEFAHQIIEAGTVSGRFEFYEGPVGPLLHELLDRYPVPDDLCEILSEPDAAARAADEELLAGQPGDVTYGFRAPGVVEKVDVPKQVQGIVAVEALSREYNLMRGDVTSYRVQISDFVAMTRLSDEKAAVGDQSVATFEFEMQGDRYLLRYDPGSSVAPASLAIKGA